MDKYEGERTAAAIAEYVLTHLDSAKKLADKAAEKLYPEWRQRFEEWKLVGGDRPYHYLGSAIWFNRMGRAFGEAMVGLLN